MHSYSRPLFALLFIVALAAAPPAQAQRAPGAAGLGVHLGEPSGITAKIYNPNRASYDILAAWSLYENFFFLNGHALFEHPLSAQNVEQPLQWYIGPGAYLSVSNKAGFGVSGTIGVDILLADHFEIYLQATPRFELVGETKPYLGGGLGLRYYF
ncbi:MAG: hypothetical protein ABEL51_00720 [Salinibacter sp.]